MDILLPPLTETQYVSKGHEAWSLHARKFGRISSNSRTSVRTVRSLCDSAVPKSLNLTSYDHPWQMKFKFENSLEIPRQGSVRMQPELLSPLESGLLAVALPVPCWEVKTLRSGAWMRPTTKHPSPFRDGCRIAARRTPCSAAPCYAFAPPDARCRAEPIRN